jgi:hypothetical protein
VPATLLLTDDLADALASAVRRGIPIETATAAAGISPRQAYEWIAAAQRNSWHDGSPLSDHAKNMISSFSEKIRRAQAQWEATQVEAIGEDADAYNAKTGLRDWRARAFLLTNHPRTRARWGQHTTVEQTGTVLHEHTVARQLTDADLEQALAALPDPS